jgi:hypothetical protein
MTSQRSFRATRIRVSAAILSDAEPSRQEESVEIDESSGDPIRGMRAEAAARLSALAEFLAPTDRTLVRWVYRDGKPVAELAGLLRTPRASLTRRVRKLVDRCRSPEFAFVAAHMNAWPAPMAHVARACVLEGRSVRSAAATLKTTVHAARSLRMVVLAMARGVEQTRRTSERAAKLREWRR